MPSLIDLAESFESFNGFSPLFNGKTIIHATNAALIGLGKYSAGELGKRISASMSSTSPFFPDPAFRRLLMYLFVGTKGGYNRGLIVRLVKDQPLNANQIAEKLQLDYKTVQHHLKLLEQNNVIVASSPKGTYGALYFLTPYMERNIQVIEEIWAKFGRT